MNYAGQGIDDKNTWECIEGHSDKAATEKPTLDTFMKKNCMANMEKSTSNFQGTAGQVDNKAYLIGHFMREFDAKSAFPDNKEEEDLAMTNDATVKVDLVFAFSGKDDMKKSFDIKAPLGPDDGKSCNSLYASGAMYITSIFKMASVSALLLTVSYLA